MQPSTGLPGALDRQATQGGLEGVAALRQRVGSEPAAACTRVAGVTLCNCCPNVHACVGQQAFLTLVKCVSSTPAQLTHLRHPALEVLGTRAAPLGVPPARRWPAWSTLPAAGVAAQKPAWWHLARRQSGKPALLPGRLQQAPQFHLSREMPGCGWQQRWPQAHPASAVRLLRCAS